LNDKSIDVTDIYTIPMIKLPSTGWKSAFRRTKKATKHYKIGDKTSCVFTHKSGMVLTLRIKDMQIELKFPVKKKDGNRIISEPSTKCSIQKIS
jgi:hypothetical protein